MSADEERVNELVVRLAPEKTPVRSNILYILVGLPYSGKSTLARKMEMHNVVHVWATKIKKNFGLNDEEMLVLTRNVIKELLGEGYNVVFDFLNHQKSVRESFVALAKEEGAKTQVIYLDTSERVLLRRAQEIHEHGGAEGRSVIPSEAIYEIQQELEEPTGENVMVIRDEKDEERFLLGLQI